MKLTFNWNKVLQAIGLAAQVTNALIDVVPMKWKPIVAGAVGIMQGAIALQAQQVNPDGTPAEVAYNKK